MNEEVMILGTRGSALALAQANHVRALLHRAFPRFEISIRIIKTSGDRLSAVALAQSGIKGLFTRELERALLLNKIHMAVHSLKDVPAEFPSGLMLGAVAKREDAADVLVGHPSTNIELPRVVYTSSPRRMFQAGLLWPECETREIRGNVETRLSKLFKGKAGDSLLLAAAGLKRLAYLKGNQDEGTLCYEPALPYRKLSVKEMIPAPGQGAIGVEIRQADNETIERLRAVNHPPTAAAAAAERAFLSGLGGGCAVPAAAYAMIEPYGLRLIATATAKNGGVWHSEKTGERRNAEALGRSLAAEYQAWAGSQSP